MDMRSYRSVVYATNASCIMLTFGVQYPAVANRRTSHGETVAGCLRREKSKYDNRYYILEFGSNGQIEDLWAAYVESGGLHARSVHWKYSRGLSKYEVIQTRTRSLKAKFT